MPGLVVSLGGKLDPSFKNTLLTAARMAQQEARNMETIRAYAPTRLATIEKALATLPAASLMRPKLEAMKAQLTGILGTAGGAAGGSFLTRFMEKMKGTGGSGMSQLISVFSNTASSLGAGISPARIFAQQAPNFIQAFTLMSKNAFAAIMRFLFNPFTWAITGMVAVVAGGSYLIYRYFHNLSVGLENVANRAGTAAVSFKQVADKMDDASKSAREHADFIKSLDDKYRSVGDALDQFLDKLREENQLEQELARSRGASAAQLAKMKLNELELEKLATNRALEQAKVDNENARKRADELIKQKKSPEFIQQSNLAENLRADEAFYKAVLDDLEKNKGFGGLARGRRAGKYQDALSSKIANELQVSTSVEGREFRGSYGDALRAFLGSRAEAEKMEANLNAVNTEYERQKGIITTTTTDIQRLGNQLDKISGKAELQQKFGIQTAGGAGGGGFVTERERIGAASNLSSISVSILDVNKKQLDVQQRSNENLKTIITQLQAAGYFK